MCVAVIGLITLDVILRNAVTSVETESLITLELPS